MKTRSRARCSKWISRSSRAPAEGVEPPSTWFEARRLSVRPRGQNSVPGEIRTHASWLRTRPPGPLVRRGLVRLDAGELGGIRTLVHWVAANVPRLRTSSEGAVSGSRARPSCLARRCAFHQHFDRRIVWHAVVESNHGLRIWSSCGHHALRRMRRLVRESNPSAGDRQSPCLPSSITRQTGSKLRQSALPRGDGGRSSGPQLRAIQKVLRRECIGLESNQHIRYFRPALPPG